MSGAFLICSSIALGQAPPGPLAPPPASASTVEAAPAPSKKPEVPPRKSILGAWRFNKDESDDGRAKMRQSREADGNNRGNVGYGGPRIGGPWPGGPMGGGGYGGHGGNPQGADESDRLGDLVNPPRELKLSQQLDTDPEVDMTDDRQHRRVFYTDGRKLEKQKDSGYQQISARWEGKKLITDEKGAHNGKLSRTFEVSPDGKQLIETMHITDSKGNHPVTVQYVYDAVDEASLSFTSH